MTIQECIDEDTGRLIAFAWPGGYPVVYYDRDNCVLCSACADESRTDEVPSFRPVAGDIFYEGPSTFCEGCNKELVSAYGDPDEREEAWREQEAESAAERRQ